MEAEDKSIFIHPSSFVEDPSTIGKGTKIWHFCHLMSQIVVGDDCTIGQNVFIAANVQIGNNVKIQNNVSLYSGVICEDDVFLGPSMVFTNVINPRSFISRKEEFKNTTIKKGASIGANATIICGNTVGEYALIGAGSVITKDVAPYAMVIGNPAKQVAWVSRQAERLFFQNNIAVCPTSKDRYVLFNDQVSLSND